MESKANDQREKYPQPNEGQGLEASAGRGLPSSRNHLKMTTGATIQTPDTSLNRSPTTKDMQKPRGDGWGDRDTDRPGPNPRVADKNQQGSLVCGGPP